MSGDLQLLKEEMEIIKTMQKDILTTMEGFHEELMTVKPYLKRKLDYSAAVVESFISGINLAFNKDAKESPAKESPAVQNLSPENEEGQ